jgi:hypothetical protein
VKVGRLVLVLLVLGAVWAPSASACSCAGRSDAERLTDAGAAFVGTLVERRELPRLAPLESSGDPFVNVYRVEQVHKGTLGETVEVHTVRSGATCGLEEPVGTRIALYLRSTPAGWSGGLCSQTTPEGMAAAAKGDPRAEKPKPCDKAAKRRAMIKRVKARWLKARRSRA